jgi:hypothetical protein
VPAVCGEGKWDNCAVAGAGRRGGPGDGAEMRRREQWEEIYTRLIYGLFAMEFWYTHGLLVLGGQDILEASVYTMDGHLDLVFYAILLRSEMMAMAAQLSPLSTLYTNTNIIQCKHRKTPEPVS